MALFVSHHPNYCTSKGFPDGRSIICQFEAYGHLGKLSTEDPEKLELLRNGAEYGKSYWEVNDLPKDVHSIVPIHQGVRTGQSTVPVPSQKAEMPPALDVVQKPTEKIGSKRTRTRKVKTETNEAE